MSTTLITLTGNVSDALGVDFNPQQTKVRITYNTDIVGTDDGYRLGTAYVQPDENGDWELADVVAETSAVDNLQVTVVYDYVDRVERKHRTPMVGTYDLTGLTGTVELSTLDATQYAPGERTSTILAEMQALKDAQVAISGIDDTDSAVAALIEDDMVGPLTTAALSASIGAAVETTAGTTSQRAAARSKRLKAQTAGFMRQTVNVTIGAIRASTADSGLESTVAGNTTASSATDTFTTAGAHGLAVGDRVRIASKTGGMWLNGAPYYVRTVPSSTTFTLFGSNVSSGGIAAIGSDITASTLYKNVPVYGYAYQQANSGGIFTLSAAVAASTDTFTTTTPHTLTVGDVITLNGSSAGGTADDINYYVRTTPLATTFTVSATRGGSTLNVTSDDAAVTINRTHPGLLVTDGRSVQGNASYPQWDYIGADPTVVTAGGGNPNSLTELTLHTNFEGVALEIGFVNSTVGVAYVYVDDVQVDAVTSTNLSGAGVGGGDWGAKLYTFPDARRRRITVRLYNTKLAGFFYPLAYPLARPSFIERLARWGFIGDSFTEGTGATAGVGYVSWVQRNLNLRDVWKCGLGSTGYKADGIRVALEDRYQNDVIDQAFDVTVFATFLNDERDTSGKRTATINAALAVWDACIAARPDAEYVIVGPWPNNGGSGVDPDLTSLDALAQTAAESRGLRFISPIQDGLTFTVVDGTHPDDDGHKTIGDWLAGHLDTYYTPAA